MLSIMLLLASTVSAAVYSESLSFSQSSIQMDKWTFHEDVKGGQKGFTLIHTQTVPQVQYDYAFSTQNTSEIARMPAPTSRFSAVRILGNDFSSRSFGVSSNTAIVQQALRTFQQDSANYQSYKLAKNQRHYSPYSYSRTYGYVGYGRF